MTRERIDSLELDKQRLQERLDELQIEVNQLAPVNARLKEALDNAQTINLVSTMFIAVGGGIISYATFTGKVGPQVADVGAGLLLAGVVLLLVATVRRWFA